MIFISCLLYSLGVALISFISFDCVRNMFPLLLALGRRLPILGDIIIAFEGKPDAKRGAERGAEREKPRPAPRPMRREGGGRPPKRYNPDF